MTGFNESNTQTDSLHKLLERVRAGELSPSEAQELIERRVRFESGIGGESIDLGFAQLDVSRVSRTGFPEVIFGEGKTAQQVASIFQRLTDCTDRVLATRVDEEKAASVKALVAGAVYHPEARALAWVRDGSYGTDGLGAARGHVAVVCAGTSDLPVAEEAAVTLEVFGFRAERIYDVGVAGIHRLFARLDAIREAAVIIVVAGMEGALAGVLGGLVSRPVIAVPTSVGYGASFGGVSALLTMLNSCAPGISVVNIDNGFGAAYNAAVILKSIAERS